MGNCLWLLLALDLVLVLMMLLALVLWLELSFGQGWLKVQRCTEVEVLLGLVLNYGKG